MNSRFRPAKIAAFLYILICFFLLSSCVSHLREAKFYYTQGEKLSRVYKEEKSLASFKRALIEAKLEVAKHPSAQAYMLKGMAELNLESWEEAEESFLQAFSYGFEKGEDWAKQLSLYGLGISLQETGLEDSCLKIYVYLLNKSKFKQVCLLAAQRYSDIMLKKALPKKGKEREKILANLLKTAEKLTNKDLSCGFYHYIQSQVYSHIEDYRKSFEEAVMAKELGLPTEKTLRDNDNQIIFCHRKLKEELSPKDWEYFHSLYLKWMEKWNWEGPETPSWKKR
ncbi:MAG: hypothetical protein U9Q97_00465 [Acidobacteriota bacterium]|nr:hypothetical protein [Acidobacteriota bacterium]